MKQKFAVYVILHLVMNSEKVDTEFMIFNVQAESNGGAEHVLLDTVPMCDNALAFSEKEMNGDYFTSLLSRSKVYDLRDFRQRCNALMNSRTHELQSFYDEAEQARQECIRLEKELADLKRRMLNAYDWLEGARHDLATAQELYGMKYSPEDDVIQGTA